jgi:hypothetical protein
MDIKVLRPWTKTFCFLPQWAAAQDDLGAAEGARTGGEAGVVAEGPIAIATARGGGGTAGPRMTWG